MTEFLRNCWYMAAWSREVGEDLLRRRLLSEPFLLYRKQDGSIAALVDRCPHRFAPLSMGHRAGDLVVCPYHGLTFDAQGQCVRNPFSNKLPKGAKVRTSPSRSATASPGSGPANRTRLTPADPRFLDARSGRSRRANFRPHADGCVL